LTIGVLHRVEELADREEGFKPKNAIPFISLIPLSEILSHFLKTSVATQKIWKEFYKIVNNFDSEFDVLIDAKKKKKILLSILMKKLQMPLLQFVKAK